MPRFKMQRLLQIGLLIGVSSSFVYFYFIYTLPAEDNHIEIKVRSGQDNNPAIVKVGQKPHKASLDNSGNKVTEPPVVEKQQKQIHSESNDFDNSPDKKLKYEEVKNISGKAVTGSSVVKEPLKGMDNVVRLAETKPEINKQPEKNDEVNKKQSEKSPEQEEVIEEVVEYADSQKDPKDEVIQKEMLIGQKEQHDMEEDAEQLEVGNEVKVDQSNPEKKSKEQKQGAVQEEEKRFPKESAKTEPKMDVALGHEESEHTVKPEPAAQIKPSEREPMHLAVVACGERVEDTLGMIKSACVVSVKKIHVHIFADDNNRPTFQKELSSWKFFTNGKLQFTVYPITYSRGNESDWIKLFRPCATQRLFLPDVLPDVELVLYVDTDILFLQSMDAIWRFFDEFNSTHIAALAPEHEDPHVGWYNRFARHPFYPPLGVNSGVMLMNLSRMREVKFVDHMPPYLKQYKYSITWGDQDLINIYFHFFPEKLFIYPCEWNYRPDHCMYMSVCKTAEQKGAQVLHGCREVFKNDKQPMFKAIFQAFNSHKVEDGIGALLTSFKSKMENARGTNCGKVPHIFTKVLEAMAARQ